MSASITARTTFEIQSEARGSVERDMGLLRDAARAAGVTIDESTWDIQTEQVEDGTIADAEVILSGTWRTITVSTLPREVEL